MGANARSDPVQPSLLHRHNDRVELAAAWTAALLALGVLLWEFHRVKIDRRANVTSSYLARYWQIDDDLLIADKGSESHRQHRHRYVKLCEDEFEAARAGVLDLHLWRQWHEWLADGEMQSRLADDLNTVDPETTRFSYLRACLSMTASHAWSDCPARMDRWYDHVGVLKARWD